ncbi:hypothetical protein E4T50_06558 [Aureobasidium sp. EXF-12298]|nr:hypothetical protein E4T50_06558 [Aureobasidium sp. EXF-12298]
MLDLTDSIIRLPKHTITALDTLIIRERRTIERQSTIFVDLRDRLSDVRNQLLAVRRGSKTSISMDGIKVEDEDEDEDEDDKVDISHMAELQRLDESPRQVELSAKAAASTLYDLQNIYSRMAERCAADLAKAEADADSNWTEDA